MRSYIAQWIQQSGLQSRPSGGGRTTTAMRAGKIRKLFHCFADRRVKKVKRVVRGRAWNVNLNQYGDYYSFAIYKNGYHRS